MLIQEDVYLKHFGKKGMRWGVRNKSNKSKMSNKTHIFENTTKAQRQAYRKSHGTQLPKVLGKAVLTLSASMAAGVGAAYVTHNFALKNGVHPLTSEIMGRVAALTGAYATLKFLTRNGSKKYKSVKSEPISEKELYIARRHVGIHVTPEERKQYESHYQAFRKESPAGNKGLK